MSKKGLFYTGFFIVLAVVFFLSVRKYLVYDHPISTVKPFSFLDQDGKQFTQKNVDGKVYVAEYFFTTCPGICPLMNNNMRKVYERFKNEQDFLILSHTSMPEVDSPTRLRHYADSMKVDTRRWVFLTGRKDSLYNTARVSYTIDDAANNLKSINDQFIHTQYWALINKKGEVREIYDGLKEAEIEAMMEKIEKMLKE